MTQKSTREQVEKELGEEFCAFVLFNGEKFEPTVSQLLESSGGSWGEFANMRSQKRSPHWIWFHLPAVNLDWMQKLVWQLQYQKVIQTWDGDRDTHQDRNETLEEAVEAQEDGIASFFAKAFTGDKSIDFPKIDNAKGSEDATFSVAMPFLDSENSKAYNDPNNKISRLKLANASSNGSEVTGLIVSRTLDESFYVTSSNTASLDQDQVVRRYYESEDEIQSRILMVSPLRLWKIGRDVVITAFPSNWEGSRKFDSTPLGHVYQSVTKSRPVSSMDLVSQIMASLITAIDGPSYAGLPKSLFAIFEAQALAQKTRQLRLYQEFRGFVAENQGFAENANQASRAITIVSDEMECFRVVMDIRDELAMISSVISEQERAFQSVAGTIQRLLAPDRRSTDATKDQPNSIKDQPDEVELGIIRWKSRISNIDQRTQVVEKALSHLLSLKLDVSNLAEAKVNRARVGITETLLRNMNESQMINLEIQGRGQRLQLDSAMMQAKANQQSRYLFAFTVVTVVFAPLSFVASFFAIPSRDFPQEGGVSWSQGQIGGGLAISLVVTIVLVVLTVLLNGLIEKRKEKRKDNYE